MRFAVPCSETSEKDCGDHGTIYPVRDLVSKSAPIAQVLNEQACPERVVTGPRISRDIPLQVARCRRSRLEVRAPICKRKRQGSGDEACRCLTITARDLPHYRKLLHLRGVSAPWTGAPVWWSILPRVGAVRPRRPGAAGPEALESATSVRVANPLYGRNPQK